MTLIEYRCIVRETSLCRDVMIDTVGVLVAQLTFIQVDRGMCLLGSHSTIVVIRELRGMFEILNDLFALELI